MSGVESFDCQFFGISPAEAELMDPQQRLFLEVVWAAVEDSGHRMSELAGTDTSLFVGVGGSDYSELLRASGVGAAAHTATGAAHSVLANRVSYLFDLRGASEPIDTACSASLVAIHRAVRALRDRDSEVAIAGGVNVLCSPTGFVAFSQAGMLAPDGLCKTFDASADGYVRGEGVGAVVLKRLSRARADHDHVYALIRGTAVGHGGRGVSLTAPSARSQAEIIDAAWKCAGIPITTADYIEAHGTGTRLGDPVEISGLAQAFAREDPDSAAACALGSVKANIGHLETAAGIASLVKVLLSLRDSTIAPQPTVRTVSPLLNLHTTPFSIPTQARPWPSRPGGTPRRAGISSFGYGGINAHIVIEEHPQPAPALPSRHPHIIPISAKTPTQLHHHAHNLLTHINNHRIDHSTMSVERLNAMLRLIAEIARVDESEIGLSDDLIDIGLDPMEMATLRTRVTTMFQLSVDAANFECCRTVQDFVSVVETEIGEDDLASEGPAERSTLDFEGLAYTLQVGRESFGHRLAVVASGLEELRDLLQRHLSGQTSLPGVWTGDASVGNSLSDLMLGGEEGAEYLRKLREAHKPDKLARLWVSGIDLDWEILWEGSIPRRMSLPTYPFESRRCWVDAKIHREDLEPHRKDSPKKTELVTMERSSAVVEQLSKSTATPRRSPSGNVLDRVRRVLAEVLGWDPSEISENAGFDELGFTSVLVREAGELFRAEFGLVSTTAMFEFKTVAALASYISTLDNLSPEPEENASAERLRADISSTANVEKKREEPPSAPKDRSPLAIIGMSGRYPMANNLAEFWQNLVTGRDCVSEIPLDRPGWSQYAKVARDRLGEDGYPRWGGFVDGYDAFEPGFFNISPLEARFLDPQERLFIEAAWECVEDAGHTPDDITSENLADNRTRVGVFAGMTYNNYQMYAASQLEQGEWIPVNSQSFSLANRVSYIMNLAGPSITVDTACSSSLGAIHLACSAIRRHECDAAIVGGVNLTLHPSKYVTLAESGFTASDGRCHSFGDGGDGYVPAEGVGAILIKPLSQAIADGDHVYATILGSAMNHDGHTFGYSVPNPIAQAEVVAAALVDAGVTSDTITYVEAHGTGTSLGDPLEIHGLADAFGVDAARTSPCAIGSVKSNIGHAEAAAGIAQVHKVVLQLTHRTLVPTLPHAARLNPKIDFEQAGFHVQCALCPWPNSETGTPRRAGVSSFGAGGVNVHLILEEAPELSGSPKSHEDAPALLVLSARTDSALRAAASRLADHLRNKDLTDNLDSIAWTLQSGRRSLKHRLAAVTHDPLSAADALERFAADGQANGIVRVADGSGRGSIGAAMEKPTKNDDAVDLALIRELAEEWLQGGDPNWRRLYPHGSPVRVPLPT